MLESCHDRSQKLASPHVCASYAELAGPSKDTKLTHEESALDKSSKEYKGRFINQTERSALDHSAILALKIIITNWK